VALNPRARHALKLSALALLLVGAWFAWRSPGVQAFVARDQLATLRDRFGAPWWSPVAFVVGYAALAAFDFSGLVLTLAGGIIFGLERGVVLNTIGANLGANAAYALARMLGKDAVAALLGARFARIQHFVEVGGFRWLLRLRLIPVVPFNLLNLAAGVAGMPWRTFAAATALGILPGTVIYTLFADAIVTGSGEASRSAFTRLLVTAGLLLLLTFTPAVARRLGWIPVPR
jgi:uncharacterized membrane protein YdjX (TVP38/TMEM64 family)